MADNPGEKAWVTFCMSTYKRPVLLKSALETIARQTFRNFEVIVSDNDSGESARVVVEGLHDTRFRYFSNGGNLGMVQSFNKSIERADSAYVVMITDDDPVSDNFLEELFQLYNKYPGYSIYCGFPRKKRNNSEIEIIKKENFITEILDVNKTPAILWSSCVMKKSAVLEVGKMPDNGSPHLTDHALIAMVGSREGGVVVNKMFSSITLHDNNFSKFNFHYYTQGCSGFYEKMIEFCKNDTHFTQERKVILAHMGSWFIVNIFNLKKYYALKKNKEVSEQVDKCAAEIMAFPFMKSITPRFYLKKIIFLIKLKFNLF